MYYKSYQVNISCGHVEEYFLKVAEPHFFYSIVFLVEMDAEHAQRVPGAEQGGVPPPQVKLKERQKFFEEAFQQDMEQYLTTGYLQIAERRGEKELRGWKVLTETMLNFNLLWPEFPSRDTIR